MTGPDVPNVHRMVDQYLEHPVAAAAYRQDPTYHQQIRLLREMLTVADRQMEAEGVDPAARWRVIRAVLYGSAGPDAKHAMDRVVEMQEAAEKLEREAQPGLFADLYTQRSVPAHLDVVHLPGDDAPRGL